MIVSRSPFFEQNVDLMRCLWYRHPFDNGLFLAENVQNHALKFGYRTVQWLVPSVRSQIPDHPALDRDRTLIDVTNQTG